MWVSMAAVLYSKERALTVNNLIGSVSLLVFGSLSTSQEVIITKVSHKIY